MGRVSKRPQVLIDLAEQAEFLAQSSLVAALGFLHAAETTFEFLANNPGLGPVCGFKNPEAAGLRRWRIHGFERHLVFYRPMKGGIEVIRVIHGARDTERLFEE